MSLGDKLRQRRQEMGLTRPQLAAKICVTPSAIANYENGISTPKPDILISLINVLEVDANYIYSDYLGNNRISKIYDQALSTEEIDSIKKYRELSEEGKRLVRLIVNEEYTRTVARSRIVSFIPVFSCKKNWAACVSNKRSCLLGLTSAFRFR